MLATLAWLCSAFLAVAANEAVVTGMRVNLRAAPEATSEIVGQVARGDRLALAGDPEGDWLPVAIPDSLSVWVYGPLVRDGVVHVSRLQVRAGPGINYRVLGVLEKGRRLTVRDTKLDWLKIEPPTGSRVWISSTYAEPVAEPPVAVSPKPEAVASPDIRVARDRPKPRPVQARPAAKPSPPARKPPMPADDAMPPGGGIVGAEDRVGQATAFPGNLTPAPGMTQGRQASYEGRLRRTSFLWRRPADYRLVGRDEKGRAVTVCYLLDAGRNLDAMLGKKIIAKGAEYWVQGFRLPMLLPSSIVLSE